MVIYNLGSMASTTLLCATAVLRKPLLLRRWVLVGRRATTLGKLERPTTTPEGLGKEGTLENERGNLNKRDS